MSTSYLSYKLFTWAIIPDWSKVLNYIFTASLFNCEKNSLAVDWDGCPPVWCILGIEVEKRQQQISFKHRQGHNGSKPLGALTSCVMTHSTPSGRSFNKFWNPDQTSGWFYLAKGERYIQSDPKKATIKFFESRPFLTFWWPQHPTNT